MHQLRIAVAALPLRLHRLVKEALTGQFDLSLTSVASGDIALMLEAARADVVVVSQSCGVLPAVAERLIDEYPHLGIVCLDVEAGSGVIYRLRPGVIQVEATSPSAIAAAIRRAANDSTLEKQ